MIPGGKSAFIRQTKLKLTQKQVAGQLITTRLQPPKGVLQLMLTVQKQFGQ